MKNTLIVAFTIFYIVLNGQDNSHIYPYNLNDNERLFLDSIIVKENKSSEELFIKSKIWIARNFKDGKEVDIFSDKDNGTIVGKGAVKVPQNALEMLGGSEEYLGYTINIFCKEGKARLIIDNITWTTYGNEYVTPKPNPIELIYWNGGKTSNKARKGMKKVKTKYLNCLIQVFDTWTSELNSSEGGYSDF